MTWGERIDTRLHAKDSAAQECMAIVRALAAERDTLQGLLKKSLERESEIEKELSEAKAMLQMAAAKVADFSGSCPYDAGLSKVCMFQDEDDCKDEYEKCWIEYWQQEASK